MKILITGSGGQIAQDFIHIAEQQHQILAPTHAELDITDQARVQKALQDWQPQVVINTAAFTQVDLAETEQAKAYAVNATGAENIARACHSVGASLIHLSTDYIFNGTREMPYQEDDRANPLSVYGQSKWQGEQLIREYCPHHLILRVSGVFGRYGHNFVKAILKAAVTREVLTVIDDQVICPTPAPAIARVLLTLTQQLPLTQAFGTYHFCGAEQTNWYQFAQRIIGIAKQSMSLNVTTVQPISSSAYNAKAKRPAYSVLDCQKILTQFNIVQPMLEHDLHDLILSTA